MAGRCHSRVSALLLLCASASAQQLSVAGRAVDENGAPVAGARIELRNKTEAGAAYTDAAGDFRIKLSAPGEYEVRAERQGFYVVHGKTSHFNEDSNLLTVTLNHQQEFSERVDVTASPPNIDPQQPAARQELDNTEILAVPYPAPQDYRNALPLADGVVQDNAGRPHFNGGATNQTSYTLDGFNLANPIDGQLDARLNIESIQSMTIESSRFAAENGRGSAGLLDIKSKMGDDRWRFGGTNFIPGISTGGGWHINKWTPRLEASGPIVKGRAWFHNGLDAFYSKDLIHGLPHGQNRTSAFSATELSRFQINLTPGNILTGGFLLNMAENSRIGLSFLNPAETTTDNRQTLFMSNLRDQAYLPGGVLLELGFADTRGLSRNVPQGTDLFQITPFGERGNYFVSLDRHFYRQQEVVNLFLPVKRFAGTHLFKLGMDVEREAFHQTVIRHDYEVLRDDLSVARYVTFSGSPYQRAKNFEGAEYVQDHWDLREGLAAELGLRFEWNEIVRQLEVAPRLGASWAPKAFGGAKLSAGWGIYYDSIRLDIITRSQDQSSLATFFPPAAPPTGPVATVFQVDQQSLRTPYFRVGSISVERKIPLGLYAAAGYLHRAGAHGFTFQTVTPEPASVPAATSYPGAVFTLRNSARDRYDAFDISLKRTFAGKYEWYAGYTRSNARTNAAVEYSLENPIFAAQMPGRLPWDAPDRFHMWGWAPIPQWHGRWALFTRNTTAAYLVEYRTGFPFSVVDENGFLRGSPTAMRLPDYFSINLHFERKFQAAHYLWAWRCGFDNLTNNGNPNFVNNVYGTPQFLTYGRGQMRAFSVRLRMLGRK
jgi:hypothetical protein